MSSKFIESVANMGTDVPAQSITQEAGNALDIIDEVADRDGRI